MDYSLIEFLGEYKRILRKYSSFLEEPVIWKDYFGYTKHTESHLEKLKYNFKLEKFKTQNDIETVKNIMRWVYEIMLFPEYSEYNGINKAIDILNYSRKNRKILNCAMHSIVLTESLLSLGYKCRSIQCLPLDPLDNDSHFINIVYIDKLEKWIALDPSYSVYFTDKYERYLDLKELREYMVYNKKYKINRFTRFDANIKRFNEKWYDAYLSKNLFRFSCTQTTQFYVESSIIYFLNPEGYGINNKEVKTGNNIHRFISNSDFFWKE